MNYNRTTLFLVTDDKLVINFWRVNKSLMLSKSLRGLIPIDEEAVIKLTKKIKHKQDFIPDEMMVKIDQTLTTSGMDSTARNNYAVVYHLR